MGIRYLCIIFTVFLIDLCSSYNIEDRQDTARSLRPYAAGSNPNNENPIFFGYSFKILNNTSPSYLIAGAPKKAEANTSLPQKEPSTENTTGCFLRCVLEANPASNSTCSRIELPQSPPAVPGDAYGITVSYAKNQDKLVACSTTKVQHCGNEEKNNYIPGYCYRSPPIGGEWNPDIYTKNLRCPALTRDIIFLLDGSGSVGNTNFGTVKDWVIQLSSRFDISDGTNRIGVIQYSFYDPSKPLNEQENIRTEITLGEYTSRSDFNNAVSNIELQGFTTWTAVSLLKAVEDFRTSSRFDDPNNAKVLILLTDGNSTDRDDLSRNAALVRSLGIITFAIGVGNAVVSELRTVATGDINSGQRVFFVRNFDGLNAITQQLANEITAANLEGVQRGINSPDANNELTLAEYGFSIHQSVVKRPTRKVRRNRLFVKFITRIRSLFGSSLFYVCFTAMSRFVNSFVFVGIVVRLLYVFTRKITSKRPALEN